MSQLDDLFALILELCTTEQIRSVLESAKGNKNVRLSAANKFELLDKNVRDALASNALPIERLYDLLQDSEENGDQHIFYYRVPRSLRDSMAFEEVSRRLAFAESVASSFPSLDLVPNGYILSDFRRLTPRRPTDWVIKVYGDETREYFTGRIVPEEGSKHLKEYDVRKYRHVLLMRWNFPDLLELRIPRDTSRGRRDTWIAQLWNTVASALQPRMFKEWDLTQARKAMVEDEKLDGVLYSLRDTQVKMPGQERATFEPYLPGAGLFAAQHTRQAVRDLLAAQSTCTRLNLTWLPTKGSDFEEPIRTTIGMESSNEIVIPGHQKAAEVDYVTDQLRRFSKK